MLIEALESATFLTPEKELRASRLTSCAKRPSSGVEVVEAKGVGVKKFVPSLEAQERQAFVPGYPGICRDISDLYGCP